VVIDKNNVVRAGNGTVAMAKEMGMSVKVIDAEPNELIAVRRNDWSTEEAQAYAIADNQTSMSAYWDEAQLYNQLKDLEAFEPGMIEAMDFDLTDVEEHFRKLNVEPPEDFPEVDENLETKHTCPKCGYKWSGG